MKLVKQITLFILAILIFTSSGFSPCFAKITQTPIETTTKDSYIIKSTLSYEKKAGQIKYPTVVLLHSIGYSSADWGDLVQILNSAGFAVLSIDLRGHGKSIYDTNLKQKTWVYFTPKTFQKYPNDIAAVLKEAQAKSKIISLENMAIIGADVGANTAILTSKLLPKKPKALVLISGSTNFKGLYTPIVLTEIGQIPVLSIASKQDGFSMQEQQKLAKFSQGAFYVKNYPTGGMGMMIMKTNPTMPYDITKWLVTIFK